MPAWLVRSGDTSGGIPLLGAPLIVLGVALLLWSGLGLSFVGRGTPNPVDAPKELVVWGPYRWVRNRMYVGVLIVLEESRELKAEGKAPGGEGLSAARV